jgi:integrase
MLTLRRSDVQRALVSVGYEVLVSDTKAGVGGSIPLDEYTVEALKAWRDRQDLERKLAGETWAETGLVFTRENGTALHPDRVTKLFGALVAGSELRRIRLHDLRHTYATLALAAGVHVKIVAARLGHARESMTLEL